MKVSTTEPFQIIYSLLEHEFLGYLFESYVVQLDQKGRLTLKHQNISSKNAEEFALGLDEIDFKLIKIMDAMQQDSIIKKFSNKKVTATEFFAKVYHKEKGDSLLQEAIAAYIEGRKVEVLDLLKDKMVFEMGHDGEPTWKRIAIAPQKATVIFHFVRNEDNTHYYPTIKYENERVDFQSKNAILVCNNPAWLLVENTMYSFEKDVDGNKLKPFLNKKYILIPKKLEDTYYERFISPLIASFDVMARGFRINTERHAPTALLTFAELAPAVAPVSLFGDSSEEIQEDDKLVFSLSFKYGGYAFPADSSLPCFVKVEKNGDDVLFHKIIRESNWEKEILAFFKTHELDFKRGKQVIDKSLGLSLLNTLSNILVEKGVAINQSNNDGKRYFVGDSTISLEVRENNDWFDVYAIVRFGPYEIPFIQLKKYIQAKKKEFVLPNGEIAVIPEEWFSKYSELFAFVEDRDGQILLQKHHLALVKELETGNLAKVSINKKLEQLRDFDKIDDVPLPVGFIGELRPYQKAGYNWMNFLSEYNFGGCLADDMGLGKTVQTLALLQQQKENYVGCTNLLIMPTSLIFNWEMEARKFTPGMKILNYTGIHREKDFNKFCEYDLVLTSYGTVRMDIDILKQVFFHYVILDESQVIKNPDSIIARSVTELKSKHRLILTGTPIENSTLDLWSQMSFVNPGLLGSQRFFKNEFLNPIEKKHDELKTKKLYSLIKPFILRRQKSQVVKDLPDKIENIQYCSMTEEQEKEYEKVKSNYRNLILDSIEQKGVGASQILLLQGLTRLRQIANHPILAEGEYPDGSGKMEDVVHMLERALAEDHKILIFSQFVKHLQLYAEYLKEKNISFSYLDGSTKERQKEVDKFQESPDKRIFLISLKAGGLGLNLTAADYVFLLDPWWNPAIEAQAIDRAYRIGQKNNVFTYKFITKNTVEEKILLLQQNKLRLAQELITTEESFVKNLSKEDIQSIFE
ncbi:MAG: superfamily helicase, family [Chitinophagaceae bacterium]|nr:superfamily helicase, family [Chitinophagaceae bacterium]